MQAAVDGPEHRAFASTCPGHTIIDRGNTAKPYVDTAVLFVHAHLRADLRTRGAGKQEPRRSDRDSKTQPAVSRSLPAPLICACLRTISIATSSACS